MPSLKEVRNRIVSVQGTQQITKAMKMVSAAKLRRATDGIVQLRPYANKLRSIMENLSSTMEGDLGGAYAQVRPVNKVLIIAVSSNRGLCGAFNSNIAKAVNKMLREDYATQLKADGVKVLCIGKKMSDLFSKNKAIYAGEFNDVYNQTSFDKVAPIAEQVINDFIAGNFDKVEVVYNQFKNPAVQIITREQMLPLESSKEAKASTNSVDYIFEPGKAEILLDLIPKSLKTQLYKAVLDSIASEHGARMTAMSKATDNAGDLLRALKLSYNKARQASITGEILEIVGGAEALNG